LSANEIHKNDIGTVFTATIKDGSVTVDLSALTTRVFIFKKPSGSTTTLSATVADSGTSGIMSVTAPSGLFDTTGSYEMQAKVSNASATFFSDTYKFKVFDNL
jgi:hypothetical protein